MIGIGTPSPISGGAAASSDNMPPHGRILWEQDNYGSWWHFFDGMRWWCAGATSTTSWPSPPSSWVHVHSQQGLQPYPAEPGVKKFPKGPKDSPKQKDKKEPPQKKESKKKESPKKEPPKDKKKEDRKKDDKPEKKPTDEPPDDPPDWGDDDGDYEEDWEEGEEEAEAEEDEEVEVAPRAPQKEKGKARRRKGSDMDHLRIIPQVLLHRRARLQSRSQGQRRRHAGTPSLPRVRMVHLQDHLQVRLHHWVRGHRRSPRSRPSLFEVITTWSSSRSIKAEHWAGQVGDLQGRQTTLPQLAEDHPGTEATLFQLVDKELAVLIFLSCEGEPAGDRRHASRRRSWLQG